METFLISRTDTVHPSQGKWTVPASSMPRSGVIVPSVVADDLSVQEMSRSWIFSI